MFFRRHKNVVQPLLAFVVVAITLWYFYKYYQENNIKLKAAKVRHHELLEERNRLSRELDAAIESKNNLEVALRTKTVKFAEKKKEWDDERDKLQNLANKEKSNFDALDSEYRMLQAKNEDLQTDYDHMKKSFDRLKEDHTKLDTEHRQNYKELKEKNEKIMVALQKQVEHYQTQENLLQWKVQNLQGDLSKYQGIVASLEKKVSNADNIKKDTGTVHQVFAEKTAQRESVGDKETLPLNSRIKSISKQFNNYGLRSRKSLSGKAFKEKQFLQNIGKLAEGISDNTNEVNDVENNAGLLRAGQFEVNVKPAGGQPQQDAYVETKHGYNDNIELINRDVKEEKQNLNLDEQPAVEAKEIDALADEDNENLERKKRDVDEPMIDDQRPDDEEIPLQRRENDNIEAENEGDEMIEHPENLL